MQKPGGLAFSYDQSGRVIEHQTFTCKHCQKIVIIPHKAPPSELGGFCYSCDALICPECQNKPCDHFEKKLESIEASYHARRSYE